MKLSFFHQQYDGGEWYHYRYDRDTDELIDLPSVVPLQVIRDLIMSLDAEAEGGSTNGNH